MLAQDKKETQNERMLFPPFCRHNLQPSSIWRHFKRSTSHARLQKINDISGTGRTKAGATDYVMETTDKMFFWSERRGATVSATVFIMSWRLHAKMLEMTKGSFMWMTKGSFMWMTKGVFKNKLNSSDTEVPDEYKFFL